MNLFGKSSGVEEQFADLPAVSAVAALGLVDQDDLTAATLAGTWRRAVAGLPGLAILNGGIAAFLYGHSPLWFGAACLAGLALVLFGAGLIPAMAHMRPTHRTFLLIPLAVASGWISGQALGSPALSRDVLALLIGPATLIALGAIPLPQFALVLGFAASAAIGAPTTIQEAVVLTVTSIAIVLFGRMHADRAEMHRFALDQRDGQKASALITMIEESDRIWFWETNREGHLTYASPKLLAAFGRHDGALIGMHITALFREGGEDHNRAQNSDRTIKFYLNNRIGFSEFPVQAVTGSNDQWWSLTGRPIIDTLGRFRGFRGSGTDLTEKRRSEAEINRLARFDSLTGLPNRLLMLQTLEQSIANALANPVKCVLMLLDLDRFKSVNDTLGHPVGDQLLKQVAKRLESVVGSKGRVGRLGGDEFTVVLPLAPSRAETAQLGKDIILALSQPYTIDGSYVSIGASVGMAVGTEDGETAEAIMRNADLALYAAKSAGRGVARFFESAMRSEAEDRRTIEIDLQNALPTGAFHLVYQPVVCSVSEAVTGFESLVRWTHPVKGPISPAQFIPIAEDIGLIRQIGDWVLRQACFEAAKWPSNTVVAVNVSAIQFADVNFPVTVTNALAQSGLPAGRLELEITESVFLDESADHDAMFAKLKSIGVRLALDDFGTGYSSLGYLKKAPFDKIKIDRSFVAGAAVPGNRNAAIIKSVVSLAESLGMDTTAEGAETMDELALIRSLGCSHIQGYIFGKPMSGADAIALLAESETTSLEAKGFDRSRAPRIRMLRSATLKHNGRNIPVRIRNVSVGGVQIEIRVMLPVGDKVLLDLGLRNPLECEVRWQEGVRMGMQFSREIDLNLLSSPQQGKARAA